MLNQWLQSLTTAECFRFFLVVNSALVIVSVAMWRAVRRWHSRLLIMAAARPLAITDFVLTGSSVLLNTGVSIVGCWLLQSRWLVLSDCSPTSAVVDCLLLLLSIDLLMYVSHRLAHSPVLYRWLHAPHHQHEDTNSLSLFVMHPGEVIGFAALMILAIAAIRPCEEGLIAFLAINLICGTVGHSGLVIRDKAVPRSMTDRLQVFLTTFHGAHHELGEANYGFYTTLWDRLFGTAVIRGGLTVSTTDEQSLDQAFEPTLTAGL